MFKSMTKLEKLNDLQAVTLPSGAGKNASEMTRVPDKGQEVFLVLHCELILSQEGSPHNSD